MSSNELGLSSYGLLGGAQDLDGNVVPVKFKKCPLPKALRISLDTTPDLAKNDAMKQEH